LNLGVELVLVGLDECKEVRDGAILKEVRAGVMLALLHLFRDARHLLACIFIIYLLIEYINELALIFNYLAL
jgi:hypothetical protein